MMIQCSCTRPGSLWNFASDSTLGWGTIAGAGLGQRVDTIYPDWSDNFPTSAIFVPNSANGVYGSNYALDPQCGVNYPNNGYLQPRQKNVINTYWTLRRFVNTTHCGGPTVLPTARPSRSPIIPTSAPTLQPTMMPTLQPTTLAPTTLAPTTLSPTTSAPSTSPTACVFSTVSCCFSLNEALVQVYLGDLDVSSHVVPQNGFTNRSVTKTLTFTEPSVPTVLAFKGYENNELVFANLMLRCQSTNPASKWNFVSLAGTGKEGWKAVESTTVTGDDLPACWFCASYTGAQSPATAIVDNTYILSGTCGAPVMTQKVRAAQGGSPAKRYWGLKRLVDQTTSCLVTHSPTTYRTIPPSCPNFEAHYFAAHDCGPTLAPTTARPRRCLR
ncbi:hypothetical protein BASA81_008410 [Batrachochytrium salamandrivorans]|nr:hypothetical protein BASA81_008410 [Batrachochytrium salamandrivorans]